MQLKTRLTVLFTALIAMLLLAFALTIYFGSSYTREEEYYKHLKQQASTKANLLFDSKVGPGVLQLFYNKAPNTLFQEEIAVYDTSSNLLYQNAVGVDRLRETKGLINTILVEKEIRFYQGNMQVVGFLFEHRNKKYIITAAAIDEYGLTKLALLRNSLFVLFLLSVIIIFIAGRFFAQQSLNPVLDLVEKVKKITATNLDLRVNEGNRKDEIAALAITFNEMLNRLENSFEAQKQFVSNISHELRTPLSVIISELELSISRERNILEYKEVIKLALIDAKKLAKLANGILDFAKANYDQSEITFKEIRLDEVLLDARQQVLKSNPDYKVQIKFVNTYSENANHISVNGNEYLLKVAFLNLMENGCKFSNDHSCSISISYDSKDVILQFSDEGIGIKDEDLVNIFLPFYRGSNKTHADGNGIGLSLTQKIVSLHQGEITVTSKESQGTIFKIQLLHL